jgi:hypothetical protein
MLGSDRWYVTMPKECMVVWVTETTEHEEWIATEEVPWAPPSRRLALWLRGRRGY